MMDWFRWWHGLSNDPKLRLIASECSMPVACVVGVWGYLLETASSNHIRGQIDNFDAEVISFHLGIDVETPCNAMKRRNMLHETGETLLICNWDKWQPKREREDVSTARVQKFRDKQKQALTSGNIDETPCNANETNVTPREDKSREDKSITQDKPARKKSTAHSLPDNFSISENVRTWAEANGHADLESHLANFIDSCRAKGYKYLDWDAAFRNAISKNWAKVTAKPKQANGQPALPDFMRGAL